jgi:hypothetical protein
MHASEAEDAPSMDAYVPGEQSLHSDEAVAPSSVAYVPMGHAVQLLAPESVV